MILVGVTGGIGAGKSTVLHHLHSLGADVLDADRIVHDLYSPGNAAYEAVTARWGRRVMREDSSIDRAAIAQIVFTDHSELAWLNAVIHPLVQQRIVDRAGRPGQRLLCCAVPLLYEAGWETLTKHVVAVWCTPAIQYQRLRARNWSEADIRARCDRQMTMDRKLALADFGIINNGSMNVLRDQCRIVYDRLCCRLGAIDR